MAPAGAARVVVAESARVLADRLAGSRVGLPRHPRTITPRWLEAALGLPAGRIDVVRILDEHHGTTARATLAVRTGDGPERRLFVKLTPPGLVETWFHDVMGLGQREVAVYRCLRPELGPYQPRVFAVGWDAPRGRSVIVLEDLTEQGATFADLRAPTSVDDAAVVLRALAGIHRAFWQSPRLTGDLAWLDAPANRSVALGPALTAPFLRRLRGEAQHLVPDDVHRAAAVLDRRDDVARALASLPSTVIHGDAHRGNLYLTEGIARFFDWQVCSRGPALQDVAYFLVTSLDPDDRIAHERELLDVYRGVVADEDGPRLDPDATWLAYRATATRAYVAGVVTATFGTRLQAGSIPRVGLERAVVAMRQLEAFRALTSLL